MRLIERLEKWLEKNTVKKTFIKYIRLKRPKDNELLVFQLPAESTMEEVKTFKDRVQEAMDRDEKVIIISGDVKVCFAKKKPRPKVTKKPKKVKKEKKIQWDKDPEVKKNGRRKKV